MVQGSSKFQKKISPYLFIAPFLLFFIIFSALPTIISLVISTLNWDYETDAVFVGLGNFIKLFNFDLITTRDFYDALKNTLIFVDRKSTRLNYSHVRISYAVYCLK